MQHQLTLIIIVLSFISCNKENKCIKTVKDTATIQEYNVVKDTCNVFEKKSHVSYFINDTIVMEGYGDRFNKQGIWEYYNKGKSITKGKFINSDPIGIWKYKNFGKIEWVTIDNIDGNYKLSIPKGWKKHLKINMVDIVNDTILDNFNMKIEIRILKMTMPFDELFKNLSRDLKKENKDIKLKKTVTIEGSNCFFIKNKGDFIDGSTFDIHNFYIEYNNKIYSISIYVKEGSNYAYNIIEEQIMRSFRLKKDSNIEKIN